MINNEEKIALIDIGGSKTRIKICSKNNFNKIFFYSKFKTIKQNPKNNFDKIKNLIQKFKNVYAISISAPGPCDYEKGIFYKSPNLPKWNKFNFISFLKKETKINKIVAQNDANLMALAHYKYFHLEPKKIVQFFTISTGLGAGLIINDQIFTGSEGFAQEIAKFRPNVNGQNKKNQDIEFYTSAGGLERRAQKIGIPSSEELLKKYHKNLRAKKIINEGIEALSEIILIAVFFINPNYIIFDGPLSRNNKWYIDKAMKKVNNLNFKIPKKVTPKYLIGELGDDAGLYGAFLYARKKFV